MNPVPPHFTQVNVYQRCSSRQRWCSLTYTPGFGMQCKDVSCKNIQVTRERLSDDIIDWERMVEAVRGLRVEFKEVWFQIKDAPHSQLKGQDG